MSHACPKSFKYLIYRETKIKFVKVELLATEISPLPLDTENNSADRHTKARVKSL
jgi:hypothetical protein